MQILLSGGGCRLISQKVAGNRAKTILKKKGQHGHAFVKSLTLFTRYRETVQDNYSSDDSQQEDDTKPTETDSDDDD